MSQIMSQIRKCLHSILLYAVGSVLWLCGRIRFKVYVSGMGNPPEGPEVIDTNNHQRNWDIVLLAPTYYFFWRKWKYIGRLSWAGRDDLFVSGYFSTRFRRLFAPIRYLLFHLNIGPILRYFNAKPIRQIGFRNLRNLFNDAMRSSGNIAIENLLAEGWESKFPMIYRLYCRYKSRGSSLTIRDCFKYRLWKDLEKDAFYSDISAEFRDKIKMANISGIKESLDEFANMIKSNHMLYFSVEGELSKDGYFKTFKAGISRIIEKCNAVKLIPINITYDYMKKGRHPVFMRFGEECGIDSHIGNKKLKVLINELVMRLQTGTMTSFVSLAVYRSWKQGMTSISTADLSKSVAEALELYRREGYAIDESLLSEKVFNRRLNDAIEWGKSKKIWKVHKSFLILDTDVIADKERTGPWPNINFVSYAINQIPPGITYRYMESATSHAAKP